VRRTLVNAFRSAREERFVIAVALLRQGSLPNDGLRFVLSRLSRPLPRIDLPYRILEMPDFLFSLVLLRNPPARARLVKAGLSALRLSELWAIPDLAVLLADRLIQSPKEARALERVVRQRAGLAKYVDVTNALEKLRERF
jgi:hypothetical protein